MEMARSLDHDNSGIGSANHVGHEDLGETADLVRTFCCGIGKAARQSGVIATSVTNRWCTSSGGV